MIGMAMALLWDRDTAVYKLWGTMQEHYQAIRLPAGWTHPAKGGKMEFFVWANEKKQIMLVDLKIYDAGSAQPTVSWRYQNPAGIKQTPRAPVQF